MKTNKPRNNNQTSARYRTTRAVAVTGLLAALAIAAAPPSTASHVSCTSGEESFLIAGYWDSPVPVLVDSGMLTLEWGCEDGVMSGTASYSGGAGNWVCSEEYDTNTNYWGSGRGSATELVLFQGSTVGSGGGCVGYEWSGNVIHFSSGANSPYPVRFIAHCGVGLAC